MVVAGSQAALVVAGRMDLVRKRETLVVLSNRLIFSRPVRRKPRIEFQTLSIGPGENPR